MTESVDHDKYDAPFGGQEDPVGYTYKAPNPLDGMNAIDPSTVNPFLNFQGAAQGGPDYLQYDIRGRSWTERMFFSCGTMYLLGIGAGGLYGVFEGLRTSPSAKLRIRINTVLNKSGRRGSRAGNALGSLAMIYSLLETSLDTFEVEKYVGGYDVVNPVLSSVGTGLLYKSTQGPKTMALAGMIGGAICLFATGARQVAPRPMNAPLGILFF